VKSVSRYAIQAIGHTRLLWAKLPELTQDLCVQSVDRSFHGEISAFSRTTGGLEFDCWHLQQRSRCQRGRCRSDLADGDCGGPTSRNDTAPMTPPPLEGQR
jgi:hypothetical protein